jgi:hypothetical protein
MHRIALSFEVMVIEIATEPIATGYCSRARFIQSCQACPVSLVKFEGGDISHGTRLHFKSEVVPRRLRSEVK